MPATQPVDLAPVAFYDDTLLVYRDPQSGTGYVAPKPMVACFELDWRSQYRKLMGNPLYKEGVVINTLPTEGGPQQGILLETRLVHAWLLSINGRRLRPTLRDKLLRYQRECAQALDDYFTHGVAINPRGVPPAPPVDTEVLRTQVALLERLVAVHEQLATTQQQLLAMLQAPPAGPGSSPGQALVPRR